MAQHLASCSCHVMRPVPHLVGRHEVVAGLHHVGQDVGHLSLLRGHVALEVAVEREQEETVGAHHPRDEVHHQKLHLLVFGDRRGEGGGGKSWMIVVETAKKTAGLNQLDSSCFAFSSFGWTNHKVLGTREYTTSVDLDTSFSSLHSTHPRARAQQNPKLVSTHLEALLGLTEAAEHLLDRALRVV